MKISRKWAEVWERERVYEADPEPGRPKYFLTAAFMYPNGPAHVGHARTYLIPDILARFKRGLGYNVLFPMGFHYTGTPILTTAERIASGDEHYIEMLSSAFGVPQEELRELTEPVKLAKYFHTLSKDAMKEYGLSIDWRREFTTIDPEFNKFIVWQFTRLRKLGYLTKGSHPVGWCPKHNMPVGMHDTKDDVEPEIGELTLIKFLGEDGVIYPAATLRPETVLGVTNMWLNPEIDYCISEVDVGGRRERWVLACEAAEKLKFQMDLRVTRKVKGRELIGRKVLNPMLGREVEILEARFVSPKFGTGVVMSVPAHAPYDYAALRDILGEVNPERWGRFKPVPLIKVEGYGRYPAKDA
ncbi:MAG: class I tRNA ligase family protein, partial [Desulfurococcales archaeon]|nr:class I tRNA ligase family protein [Desulfurococcales archaeon]